MELRSSPIPEQPNCLLQIAPERNTRIHLPTLKMQSPQQVRIYTYNIQGSVTHCYACIHIHRYTHSFQRRTGITNLEIRVWLEKGYRYPYSLSISSNELFSQIHPNYSKTSFLHQRKTDEKLKLVHEQWCNLNRNLCFAQNSSVPAIDCLCLIHIYKR